LVLALLLGGLGLVYGGLLILGVLEPHLWRWGLAVVLMVQGVFWFRLYRWPDRL
jgi:hypothetical protein